MKSVHLTNAWHEASGGIGTFYRALMTAASAQGHDMRLIVPGKDTRVEDVSPHVRIYHLQAPHAPLNRNYRWLLPQRYLKPGSEIRDILLAERPDLIEICDKYTLQYLAGVVRRDLLFPAGRRPTLVALSCERMIDNLPVYMPRFPFSELFCRTYMKWLYFGLFDHHITVSDFTAKELREASHGHMVRRGVWIRGMGVDVDSFDPSRRDPLLRRRLLTRAGGSERSILLLYAGRLAPEKSLDLLIGVMQRLSLSTEFDFRLAVAGDGVMRASLERATAVHCPGRLVFLGHIGTREELAGVYASADAFVHPNPAEPFGIAPLEAMASGLPLVAPNRGGVLSYASESNSWPAEPTAAGLASAVLSMARQPAVRRAKAMAALETARSRAWANVAADFIGLYRAIHEFRLGASRTPVIPPDFLSTAGDWLGRELQEPS